MYALKTVKGIVSGARGMQTRNGISEWQDVAVSEIHSSDLYYACIVFNNGSHLPLPIAAGYGEGAQALVVRLFKRRLLANAEVAEAIRRYQEQNDGDYSNGEDIDEDIVGWRTVSSLLQQEDDFDDELLGASTLKRLQEGGR